MHIVHGGKQNKGEGHTAYVMSIAISSDGKYLVILSANYNLMKIRC
jgi:WD40 repeat protein